VLRAAGVYPAIVEYPYYLLLATRPSALLGAPPLRWWRRRWAGVDGAGIHL